MIRSSPTLLPRRRRAKPSGTPNGAEARSAQILDAATAIFARDGYRNTDVQVVADAIKVGKASVYRRFPTKRDLFIAAVDRGMQLLHDAVTAAVDESDDPLDQIADAIRAYLDFFAMHPELVELLIQERAEFRTRATPTYADHRRANIGRWTRLYKDLMADGRIRRVPVDRITDVLSGILYATMFVNFFTGRKKSPAAQAGAILDVVFHGILTPAERSSRQRKGARP